MLKSNVLNQTGRRRIGEDQKEKMNEKKQMKGIECYRRTESLLLEIERKYIFILSSFDI